jgi:riboflavin kinase/FMN adenylyltransferase
MNLPAHIAGLGMASGLPWKPLHLAIGMFDGVHLGHRTVVEAAVQAAREGGGLSGVLTFNPHPSAIFNPEKHTRLIMDPSSKAHLLQRLGIDVVITEPFTREFARIEAGKFLPAVKEALPGLAAVYVGEDWRFGAGRRGDVAQLVAEARKMGMSVFSASPVNLDGQQVSSTRIRGFLENGDVASANGLLGSPYFAEGAVEAGKRLGHRIGYPTLNLPWTAEFWPRFGVYAVRVSGPESLRPLFGVANFGLRPTVESSSRPLLETHLLGNCPFTTGDSIHVEWLQFLRPEMKFSSVDELRLQIAIDVRHAEKFFEV